MEYYKRLSIDQKINLKSICYLCCGYSFEELGEVLPFDMRINLIYSILSNIFKLEE